MRKTFSAILFFSIACQFFAQEDSVLQNSFYDNLLEEMSTENEDTQIYDLLEQLTQEPLLINYASQNDLTKIPFIDYKTANEIIDYRNQHGIFHNKSELYQIKTIDNETIDKILPYISFEVINPQEKSSIISFQNSKINFRSRQSIDLKDNLGFLQNKFAGSKLKSYQRFQLINDRYRLNFLTEKDPGENSFNDFYSYHLQIKKVGFIENITLGDYLVEFGQGLAMWSPYSYFKSIYAVNTLDRKSHGILPYVSTDENQFLRGASVQLAFNNFNITSFYSYNKVDASIDSTTSFVTSMPIDGYHRTFTEINKKKRLKRKIYGSMLSYTLNSNIGIGFLYYKVKFGNLLYNDAYYKPKGDEFEFYSLDYHAFLKSVSFSGEFSYNNISVASINNIEINITPHFSLVSSFRNYPHNYINLFSNGFGGKNGTQNEIGFYTGFKLKTYAGVINFYYDQFKFPYPTNSNSMPSSGKEFLIYYYAIPFEKTKLFFKYKNENKEVAKLYSDENIIDNQLTQNIRLDFIYEINKFLSLKSRIESIFLSFSKTKNNNEKGFLVYQDVRISPASNLLIDLRTTFFKTDSFNSRIYEYENDLDGVITNPPLYGEGIRWYLYAKYKLPFNLIISLKYSELYKPKEKTIGSGYTEIIGNIYNSLNLQIDLQL
ncbi:ComEA family DNA-binding protein [Melioribacteraceae bacterium 4301-Me]|uniref:ComEA family DNA-binding protein n=1 Tax=Pyranulibacter aquaticus TaxID=3163344 RepID=UPI00359BD9F4